MRKIEIMAFLFLACIGLAASPGPAKPKAKKASSGPTVSEQMQQIQQQLKAQQDQIKQQQDQINQLQQQLQGSGSQLQQLQQQNQQLQGTVQQATQSATSAQQAAQTANSNVSDLKTTTINSLQETNKKVADLEHPASIHYKGLSLTPGGYIAADFLYRNRNENADETSSFGNAPFGSIANSKLSEFRGTARQSRLFLLAEGKAGNTKLTGYYEMDFLSPSLSNYVQVNAWNPRMRQAWLQADFKNGWTLSTGQFWSLMTTDRKGIALRAEFIPTTVEASYVVGYDYVRQMAFRATKNWSDKVWAAVEIANPETTVAGSNLVSPLFGFNNSSNALSPNGNNINFLAGVCSAPTGFSTCNPAASAIANGMSTNLSPDMMVKVAFEPGWGHYEIKALARSFRDRYGANGTGTNHTSWGGGVGAAAVLPVVPKKLDLIAEGLVGRGIGRYGAAANSDVTVNPAGEVVPLQAVHALVGLEAHPHPKLDLYLYGGDEYYGRSAYTRVVSGAIVGTGYGSPLVNNTNCGLDYIPTGEAACGAQNKNVAEGTFGFWYRFYKGNFGILQYGMQYEYFYRNTYSAIGGAPKGLDSVAFSAFRYFLP